MTTPSDQPNDHPNNPEPPAPAEPSSRMEGFPGMSGDQPQDYQSAAVVPSQPPPPYAQQPYPAVQQPYPGVQQQFSPYQQSAAPSSGLYVAAAVINWVVLGITVVSTLGIGIIAAAWMVPMTILTHKGAKDGYKHTGLAVCTLLFCGLISGILMLVDEGNRRPKPLA